MTRRVLVTGAAGRVAQELLPGLGGELRLLDRHAPEDAGGAEVLTGELTDRGLLAQAVDGVDAVLHLAGDPRPDAEWESLVVSDVDGVVALLAAAREAGVHRVVYASSVHAMGRYEAAGRTPIDPTWAPAPCCTYGASKAFDEAVAGVLAHRHGVSTIGLRLGATFPRPPDVGSLPGWLGPLDLRRLVRRALDADVLTGVYPGISANTRQRWDLGTARAQLGYEPVQDSEVHAAGLPGVEDDLTTCARP